MSLLVTIRAELPADRWTAGNLWLADDEGAVVAGPWACRGKADGQAAAKHGNPTRDPTLPYGDHPAGRWRCMTFRPTWTRPAAQRADAYHTYGPGILLLEGEAGDALTAMQRGRTAIGIHAGDETPDGALRATYGCLRTVPEAVWLIGHAFAMGWVRGYVCEVGG